MAVMNVLKSGVFWDIENIPVKKAAAHKRVPDIKRAIDHFVHNIVHFPNETPPKKELDKFIVVAREKATNRLETTAETVKAHIIQNGVRVFSIANNNFIFINNHK